MADVDIGYETYRKLTSLIYGAVLYQDKWTDFLEELHWATGGVRTHLFGFDIPAGISLGLTSAGYDPDFVDTYIDYYGEVNSWAVGFAKGDPGVVIPSQNMCPKDELFRTEFYADWVRPQEDAAAGGGALIFKDETRMLAFGGNIRLSDEEKLEGPWLRTVGLMIPHLQQAFEISRALAGRTLELDLLRTGQAQGGVAVLLLADNGFVLYANEAGEQMLREGLVLHDDQAGRATFRDDDAALALESCLGALRRGDTPVAASFACCPDKAAPRYVCRLAQFAATEHGVTEFALVTSYQRDALLVTLNPVRTDATALEALIAEYGLTDAEIAVATGIAGGNTPAELAELRAVSIHTVRNQLKSAMFKTGSRRQADLVRMVERARAGLRQGDSSPV